MSNSVTRWSPYILTASKRWGIDPGVLAALIEHESGGREGLTSSAGAGGLTQFMPGTATGYHVNVAPGHAKSQIFGAAHYLHDLGFRRDPRRALASYNAGPGNVQAGMGYANAVLSSAKKYGGLRGGIPSGGGGSLVTGAGTGASRTTTRTTPGVDNSANRTALITQFVQQGGADNPNAVLGLAASLPSVLHDTPSRTTVTKTVGGSSSYGAFAPSGRGAFHITGPNPGRLTKPLVSFARKVAGVYGRPLTGSDGSGHSKMTVDGNVSDHWSGNATDIPATGNTLLKMGRAALIAAGMPRAQAMKAKGGLYNVGGHQVIFLTNQGGNHFNHLHISV